MIDAVCEAPEMKWAELQDLYRIKNTKSIEIQ